MLTILTFILMNDLKLPKPIFPILLFLTFFISCKKEQPKAPPPMQAPFVMVKSEDVPIYKDFAGQTFGELDIELIARVDGILTGIYFKEGQKVKKGQLLYTIDPLEYETKVEQARGQLAVAQSSLVNANEELKRIRPLADMNAVSKRELDAAVAKDKAAKSNYASMQASLKNQEIERGYCNIKSPIDGVIGLSNARLGDYITKAGNASRLNMVSKLDKVRVQFTVSESDYLRYQKRTKQGEKITDLQLILSDGSTHPQKGTLNFSDTKIDPTTGTVTIEAQFPNPDGTLRSGQFGKVRVLIRTEKNAIVIPQKAVTEIQGLFQVSIIDDKNTIQTRMVEVGQKIGIDWIITKGLKSNEKVAIIGNQFIQPGSTVAPVPYVADKKQIASSQND
ncbi:efflux RND transporter periplasmic adaptor subunit [uncultured Flavobacterium sp.]|uniref:efflux RND transporter periplasmic adaptor subunit n=1 Tax=uncultured Flavobacterium sp. TaxID=165435 RepID=UPI00292EC71B|nr:efflux RND transporter periplasmic adaptor subunit [uncultured Flavobacterium sp.]